MTAEREALIAKLGKRHIRREFYRGEPTPNWANHFTGRVHLCASCSQPWPCDVRTLLDAALAARPAPEPHGFDVTDPEADAPDGARMVFERHGGRWEPVDARPAPEPHQHRFDVVIRDDAHMRLLGCSDTPCEEVYQWDK